MTAPQRPASNSDARKRAEERAAEKDALVTATLLIGGFYSRCGACNGNADPAETHHVMEVMRGEGCGAEFTETVYTYARVIPPGSSAS